MSAASSAQDLIARVATRRGARVTGLFGLGVAHTVLRLARLRPVVFVCRGQLIDDVLRDLRFLAGPRAARVLSLPADERTPYHAASPDPLVVMERAAALHKIAVGGGGGAFDVLVLSAESAARRGVPYGEAQRMAEVVTKGDELDRGALAKKLLVGGYSQVNSVEDPGTFAVRGSIIDVYWAGSERPVRIDLFGDTVDTLKYFDPHSQRTLPAGEAGPLTEVSFGAAREVHLDDITVARAHKVLRELADHVEYPTKKLRELLDDLDNRLASFGIEGLLPAFYGALETPLQVVERALGAAGFTVVIDDPGGVRASMDVAAADFAEHHRQAIVRGDLTFDPSVFLLDSEAALAALRARAPIEIMNVIEGDIDGDASTDVIELRTPPTLDLRQDILRETTRTDREETGLSAHSLLEPLVKRIRELKSRGRAVLLPVASLGGVERLRDLLHAHRLEVRYLKEAPDLLADGARAAFTDPSVHAWTFIAKPVDPARGAELCHADLAVIAEEEIFGRRSRRSTQNVRKGGFKTTLSDLSEGDHVVHVEHGVALFQGLTRLNVRGQEQDYLLLVYDGADKLYLPVHRIQLVQKYTGVGAHPPRLDKLGGTGWETTKKKVKAAVVAMAQDLLALYAKRELAQRPQHPTPDEGYWSFEAAFPFETTPDQQKAIDDTLADMQRPRPMDRLICGDVGYGKTEVGMRAAMLCVLGARQVAVLAPTTVLAQQHFQTFQERFKGTSTNIEVVSRFKKPGEVKEILTRAKEGKLDVLIGTHRLLSSDVSFGNLGLILVDEEQRFGVKAKEALKKLKHNVDVMTLTATPIPRTLQMGFFGIRDMSVIETPPVDRRAIRTSILKKDDEVIREAILRELARGGQVYFVHNRVRSIQATADYVKRLVPEARIGVGHGQMEADDLEDVMLRFMKHELNILVCTAIIETGIDVPSANTMFIDHAEDFGLAQLYQLRGRVGRSKDRAFAYLMIQGSTETLHPEAKKRLEILQRFTELGAGFQVAQHDLELRGAGDLLGGSQHGHVTAVGYDLYASLLRQAVEELKGKHLDDTPDPDINIPIAAFIPDKYIVDMHERLQVYQRLATAGTTQEIYDVTGSLSELYGEPPPEVSALADVMALKMKLKAIAGRALDVVLEPARAAAPPPPPPPSRVPLVRGRKLSPPPPAPAAPAAVLPRVVVTLGDKSKLDPAKLAAFLAQDPSRARLTPQMKLVYTPTEKEWRMLGEEPVALARDLLRRLTEAAGPR